MKNVSELTEELCRVFRGIEDGSLDIRRAAEMNNTAGKIIKAQNLLLQVAALNRTRVASPFLLEKENA